MKTSELVVDLKDAKNEQDVFRKFNEVMRFAPEEQYKNWNMQWDSFDDML